LVNKNFDFPSQFSKKSLLNYETSDKVMTLPQFQFGEAALDFELNDLNGNPIRLSHYYKKQPVVLSFLRGFL